MGSNRRLTSAEGCCLGKCLPAEGTGKLFHAVPTSLFSLLHLFALTYALDLCNFFLLGGQLGNKDKKHELLLCLWR